MTRVYLFSIQILDNCFGRVRFYGQDGGMGGIAGTQIDFFFATDSAPCAMHTSPMDGTLRALCYPGGEKICSYVIYLPPGELRLMSY